MRRLVTVEVGGSSVQSAVFQGGAEPQFFDGLIAAPKGGVWALAAPGLVTDGRVQGAHHLGWHDVQAWEVLGFSRRPVVSMNDAVAAAFGEFVLRGRTDDFLYVGIGTGVGSALVAAGEARDTALGHLQGFSDRRCGGCNGLGCLDASIGGHALPARLELTDVCRIADLLSRAIRRQHDHVPLVVLGGGVPRRYPRLVTILAEHLADIDVQPTRAPKEAKSAAHWGLAHAASRAG